MLPNAPSPLQWKNLIEAWVAAAATSERDVLGPYSFKDASASHGYQWELSFESLDRTLLVSLFQGPDGDRLVLQFGDPTVSRWFEPALEIFDDGPNIPADEIKVQLAEQLLSALDSLAPPDAGTPR
jgi:hypothetical protein